MTKDDFVKAFHKLLKDNNIGFYKTPEYDGEDCLSHFEYDFWGLDSEGRSEWIGSIRDIYDEIENIERRERGGL